MGGENSTYKRLLCHFEDIENDPHYQHDMNAQRKRLRLVFDDLDKDGNQTLEKEELKDLWESFTYAFEKSNAGGKKRKSITGDDKSRMQQILESDGNNSCTFAEFKLMVEVLERKMFDGKSCREKFGPESGDKSYLSYHPYTGDL